MATLPGYINQAVNDGTYQPGAVAKDGREGHGVLRIGKLSMEAMPGTIILSKSDHGVFNGCRYLYKDSADLRRIMEIWRRRGYFINGRYLRIFPHLDKRHKYSTLKKTHKVIE